MQKNDENSNLKCPVCGGIITGNERSFPFCCQRCQMVDLGRWFSGSYTIPASETLDDHDFLTDQQEE